MRGFVGALTLVFVFGCSDDSPGTDASVDASIDSTLDGTIDARLDGTPDAVVDVTPDASGALGDDCVTNADCTEAIDPLPVRMWALATASLVA